MKFFEVVDMTDQIIEYWTVIERTKDPDHVNEKSKKNAWWLCRCKCGVEKPILGAALRNGNTKSCGCRCYKRKSIRANIKTKFPRHHGYKNTNLYTLWNHLLLKCYNPDFSQFHNYGNKGITVCDDWRRAPNFIKWAFKNGWKRNHSLELKEGEKIFSPDTVYWIPKSEKISNKKKENGNLKYRNLLGRKFGYLSIISQEIHQIVHGLKRTGYLCQCICGKQKFYTPCDLLSKKINSCGCRGRKYEWSNKYEKCIECQDTKFSYSAKGLCRSCYMKPYNKEYEEKQKKAKICIAC